MKTYILLLRGVMPTGKNKVPMAQLREVLTKAKLTDVQTYIQSGNVFAKSTLATPDVEKLVHDQIKKHFGGDIAVISLTRAQVAKILNDNPFKKADTERLYFTMLAEKPDATFLEEFLSINFSPDKVHAVGKVIYTLYATKYSDSKFNNNFSERKLKVAATTRNFNTMTKLLELSNNH